MGTSPITLRSILGFLFVFVQLATALKFDLTATSGGGKNERCIRNFVSKDQLVVVTATVGGTKGDGQKVNIHVRGIRTGEMIIRRNLAAVRTSQHRPKPQYPQLDPR